MRKKRDLLREMNITQCCDGAAGPLDIDAEKIKRMTNKSIASAYAERKNSFMKNQERTAPAMPRRRIALICAASAFILSIGVFAAGNLAGWYSSSSSKPDYAELPTAQQCIKDVGYAPILVEAFKNGYTFNGGSIVDNELVDDSGSSSEHFKSLSFKYEKDGDTVSFTQIKRSSQTDMAGELIKSVGGTEIYYYSYLNKRVPGDYELTDADKKAQESGEIIFSFGSDEVTTAKVQCVSWMKNGIHCMLLQTESTLSAEALADMAIEALS